MPLSAVTFAGQLRVSSGSTTATRGRRWLLSTPTFIWFSVSVSTAAADTSEPVPAVVGKQISGMIGTGDLAVADVHAGRAAVRQHHGGDLRQVHVAAAAQAQDAVGAEVPAGADGVVGGAKGRLRLAAGEQFDGHARLAQRRRAPDRPGRLAPAPGR